MVSARRPRERPSIESLNPREPIQLTGIRVLLVDDDVEQLGLLSSALENAEANVRCATSAEQAIEELGRRAPDVIVSDINMPDCDGYYFLRRVRSRTPRDGGATPAIALTGNTRTEDHTRALLAGYQRHLSKPCQIIELLLAIREVVDGTRGLGS